MNTQEKLKAIIQRVPLLDESYTAEHISVMLITSYLDALSKEGLVEGGYHITSLGKNVVAVCEEFDWKPSDADIKMYVDDMIDEELRPAFAHFITEFRDNSTDLIERIRKFKSQQNE